MVESKLWNVIFGKSVNDGPICINGKIQNGKSNINLKLKLTWFNKISGSPKGAGFDATILLRALTLNDVFKIAYLYTDNDGFIHSQIYWSNMLNKKTVKYIASQSTITNNIGQGPGSCSEDCQCFFKSDVKPCRININSFLEKEIFDNKGDALSCVMNNIALPRFNRPFYENFNNIQDIFEFGSIIIDPKLKKTDNKYFHSFTLQIPSYGFSINPRKLFPPEDDIVVPPVPFNFGENPIISMEIVGSGKIYLKSNLCRNKSNWESIVIEDAKGSSTKLNFTIDISDPEIQVQTKALSLFNLNIKNT